MTQALTTLHLVRAAHACVWSHNILSSGSTVARPGLYRAKRTPDPILRTQDSRTWAHIGGVTPVFETKLKAPFSPSRAPASEKNDDTSHRNSCFRSCFFCVRLPLHGEEINKLKARPPLRPVTNWSPGRTFYLGRGYDKRKTLRGRQADSRYVSG